MLSGCQPQEWIIWPPETNAPAKKRRRGAGRNPGHRGPARFSMCLRRGRARYAGAGLAGQRGLRGIHLGRAVLRHSGSLCARPWISGRGLRDGNRDRMSVPPGTLRHPHGPTDSRTLHPGSENLDRPCNRRAAVHRSGRTSRSRAVTLMNELPGQSLDAAVVIIGSGQAGGRAAEALRLGGHVGPITMIGEESHPPYERPALSKGFLSDASLEQIAWVRPAVWYTQAGVT